MEQIPSTQQRIVRQEELGKKEEKIHGSILKLSDLKKEEIKKQNN